MITNRIMEKRRIFLRVYILAVPFQRALDFSTPLLQKLQLPELFFLPLLLTQLNGWRRLLERTFWRPVDLLVLAWPLVAALSLPGHPRQSANMVALVTVLYTAALYFVGRLALQPDHAGTLSFWFILAAIVTAIPGGVGWILAKAGLANPLALSATTLWPYFGFIPRAQALAATPNMLASILMIGALFLFSRRRQTASGVYWTGMLLLLSVFILTISKTVIPLIAGIAVIQLSKKKPLRRGWLAVVFLAGFLAYAGVSHLVLVEDTPQNVQRLQHDRIIGPGHFGRLHSGGHPQAFYWTNYAYNKRASLEVFKRTAGRGIGIGGYREEIGRLQLEGFHPGNFPRWVPHSTYFGLLAETGWPGFALIGAIWLLIGFRLLNRLRHSAADRETLAALAGIYVAISIEALCTDLLFFRHYWLLLVLFRHQLWQLPAKAAESRPG